MANFNWLNLLIINCKSSKETHKFIFLIQKVDQDGYDYSFSATAAENSNSRLRQREDPPANSNPSKYYKAHNTDDRRSMPSVDRCPPVTDIHRQSLPIEHHKLTRVSGQPLLDTNSESHSHSSANFVFRPWFVHF